MFGGLRRRVGEGDASEGRPPRRPRLNLDHARSTEALRDLSGLIGGASARAARNGQTRLRENESTGLLATLFPLAPKTRTRYCPVRKPSKTVNWNRPNPSVWLVATTALESLISTNSIVRLASPCSPRSSRPLLFISPNTR